MDNVPVVLALAALVIGLVDEVQHDGKSLPGWGVVLLGLAGLWGFISP